MFLFSRQLDTQCAIFGTNGTPAYNRSASRTRWNYRSFACSVTGNDIQPYTYLQVDIPLLLVLPSELRPREALAKIWWMIDLFNCVTLYVHTRVHARNRVRYVWSISVSFFLWFPRYFCFLLFQFLIIASSVSFWFLFNSHWYAPDHRVAFYREHARS